ncbi:acyltransferase family protein [Myxococcus sp. Y35]|uniref:acyltransferase family protein n=1 Tax=Pseudomyxococcus flavus TaxID=3115648 RepID=UPI003CEE9F4B
MASSPTASPASASSRRMDGLDLLRACAILGVLLFHAPAVVHEAVPSTIRLAFAHGWTGVNLFFVLSGYLVGRQVFGPDMDTSLGGRLRTFWTKRWMRTLPLYFVVLAVYALKPWLVGAPFLGGWHYALFLQNFEMPRDFVQSWSLCVEEHFYLVLPVLAFALGGRRWPAGAWLLLVALSIVARWRFSHGLPPDSLISRFPELAPWSTDQHLDGLGIGVFLARTAPTWKVWPQRWRVACGAFGAGVLALTLWRYGAFVTAASHVWISTGLAVGFGGVLVGLESLRLPPWPRWGTYQVAVLSYGAYLWHGLMVRVFERLGLSLGAWGLDLLAFISAVLGVAWVTYVAVERPCLRMRDQLLARWASSKAPHAMPTPSLRDELTTQEPSP